MSAGILVPSLFCLLTLSSVCSLLGPHPLFRQCTRCGPSNTGRCFGPDICCLENNHCYTGPEVHLSCAREGIFLSPCQDRARACGGRCRPDGRCCNDAACVTDVRCYDHR